MKKILLPILLLYISTTGMSQKLYSIATISGNLFSPDSISIMPGDSVVFTVGSFHTATQVSEATWLINGDTPLPGGFDIPSSTKDTIVIDTSGVLYFVCIPHAMFGMKGKIVVESPLSLKTLPASANGIRIYPNPAQSIINVQLSQPTVIQSISLVNMQGVEMLSQLIHSSISGHILDVGSLEKGIYQLVISTEDKKLSNKIVVQ